MLRRNLLYTAITRSKQSLIICGEQEAFRLGIERVDDQLRKTNLYDKLKILAEVTNAEKIVELSNETIMEIDPMIGMENVTPYDFM